MFTANAYTNPNTVVVHGLADYQAKTNTNGYTVMLRFRDTHEMQELQNALNRLFPENAKCPFPEPKEDGFYMTQTGVLLNHNAHHAEWSVPCLYDLGKTDDYEARLFNWVPYEESYAYADWSTVLARFGDEAFPLIPVYVTPR